MAYQPSANTKIQQISSNLKKENEIAANWEKTAKIIAKISTLRSQIKDLQAQLPAGILPQQEYSLISEAISNIATVERDFQGDYRRFSAERMSRIENV